MWRKTSGGGMVRLREGESLNDQLNKYAREASESKFESYQVPLLIYPDAKTTILGTTTLGLRGIETERKDKNKDKK